MKRNRSENNFSVSPRGIHHHLSNSLEKIEKPPQRNVKFVKPYLSPLKIKTKIAAKLQNSESSDSVLFQSSRSLQKRDKAHSFSI